MTDKPEPEIADAVQVRACDVGHVHMTFLREDGSEIAVAILEIEEALTVARSTVRMALKAKEPAESVPSVVDGDVEKHTKH